MIPTVIDQPPDATYHAVADWLRRRMPRPGALRSRPGESGSPPSPASRAQGAQTPPIVALAPAIVAPSASTAIVPATTAIGFEGLRGMAATTALAADASQIIQPPRAMALWAGITDTGALGLYSNGADNGLIDWGPLTPLRYVWIHKADIGANPASGLQHFTPADFFDWESDPSAAQTNADTICDALASNWNTQATADKYGFVRTGGALDRDANRLFVLFDHENWWFSHDRQMREFGVDYGAASAAQYNGACAYVARRIMERARSLMPRCQFAFYHQPSYRTYPARNSEFWSEFEEELADLSIANGLLSSQGFVSGHLYCLRTTQTVPGVATVSEPNFSLLMQRNCEDVRRASQNVGARPWVGIMWYSYVGVSEIVRQRDIELTLLQAIDKGASGIVFAAGSNATIAVIQDWIDSHIIPALEALKLIPAGLYGA